MTIREDSKQILDFIYSEYVNNNKLVGTDDLLTKFNDFDGHRIDRTIKYLRDLGYIEIILLMGNDRGLQNFILKKITPLGIHEAESRL